MDEILKSSASAPLFDYLTKSNCLGKSYTKLLDSLWYEHLHDLMIIISIEVSVNLISMGYDGFLTNHLKKLLAIFDQSPDDVLRGTMQSVFKLAHDVLAKPDNLLPEEHSLFKALVESEAEYNKNHLVGANMELSKNKIPVFSSSVDLPSQTTHQYRTSLDKIKNEFVQTAFVSSSPGLKK